MRAPDASPSESRAGGALAAAVLFALVALLVGHGVLVVGRTQRWVTAADGARWAEDEAGRAALTTAVAGLDSLPSEGPLHTPWGVVEVGEVSPEVRLFRREPEPGTPGTGWATVVAAPVAVHRVVTRAAAARVGGATFDPSAPRPVGPDEPCPDGLPAGVPTARIGPLADDGKPGPRLGILDLEDLLERLPPVTLGRLELSGSGPDACETLPGFGDPDRPGACPGVWGSGARRGDLTLAGRGQGVLAVSGDLTLSADARFRGWVWVGGTLRLSGGSELRGLVDVADRLVVEPGASFLPDGCAAARAVEASPSLRVPKGVGPPAWPWFRP